MKGLAQMNDKMKVEFLICLSWQEFGAQIPELRLIGPLHLSWEKLGNADKRGKSRRYLKGR